jgi:hypothetical protein
MDSSGTAQCLIAGCCEQGNELLGLFEVIFPGYKLCENFDMKAGVSKAKCEPSSWLILVTIGCPY